MTEKKPYYDEIGGQIIKLGEQIVEAKYWSEAIRREIATRLRELSFLVYPEP